MIFYDPALERYIAYRRYWIVKVETVHTTEGPLTRRIYKCKGYNCYGKLIQDTHVATWGKEKLSISGFVDARSLHAWSLGCCPPALEKYFTGTEAPGAEPVDAAMEAMKLHKRGYFGGGG